MMKLSIYNYIQKVCRNKYLVWNTFSGAILSLTRQEFIELTNLSGPTFDKNKEDYISNNIIVRANEDELGIIEQKRKDAYFNTKGCSFRVVTTTACNARCAYCYEQLSETCTINQKVADDILNYIFKEIEGKETFSITWFGGEPLINKNIINYMNKKIREHISNKPIKYTNRIITNASLFDEALCKLAKEEWKLDSIQITLDGTRKKHNKIKNYIGIKDAFSLTIKNINTLLKYDLPVVIRLNYGLQNYRDLKRLIKYLKTNLIKKVNIYPSPIFSINGNENSSVIQMKKLGKYHYGINKCLKKCGFKEHIIDFPVAKANPCGSTLPTYKVIMPDGRFFKCATEMKYNDHCVGSIYEGIKDTEIHKKWLNLNLDEECKKCVYLPICQGGCRAQQICSDDMMKCCITKYAQNYIVSKAGKYEL